MVSKFLRFMSWRAASQRAYRKKSFTDIGWTLDSLHKLSLVSWLRTEGSNLVTTPSAVPCDALFTVRSSRLYRRLFSVFHFLSSLFSPFQLYRSEVIQTFYGP